MDGPLRKLARRAFKPVYSLYYRFLFGRRFPLSGRVSGWVRSWEGETGRGDVPVAREVWERQYESGGWEFMRGLDELARYSVIAGYLRHLAPGGAVLDVGSGEGILRDELGPPGACRYLGIDLSAAAVEMGTARARGDGRTAFLVADAERYTPTERWDAIVFNECVYYFEDPLGTVGKYRKFLTERGVLVVSMFESRRAAAIHRRLHAAFHLIEETRIGNRKGTWVVSLLR